MPRIVLKDLVKRYGSVEVLHCINLEMAEEEFTVLVGPSGCGKSTTLRMIAGLETVSDGEIYFGDQPVSRMEPKDRDIAMVFQDYALYPHMDVARNMSFALQLQGRPREEIDRKVRDIAKMLGLDQLLDRKPAELSGGQRQRVAMGRALTKDAGTFLFDEPLSNLDAKLRGQMRAELALLSKQVRKNMIYVTHDQVEAMTLADRIVVMHGGHIQQQGTPQELFEKPANRFVAGFIGSPPMNFLEGELADQGGALRVAGDGFSLKVDPELARRAQHHGARSVIVGVRPSDLSLGGADGNGVTADVKVVEYIGAQTVLVATCASHSINIETKSTADGIAEGVVNLSVREGAMHLFDRDTGTAI